jgi:hypothetical protein
MQTLTFLELAHHILESEKRPISVEAIWETAKQKHLDSALKTKGKTPWQTLAARLYVAARDRQDTTPFVKIGSRPALFFLKELMTEGEQAVLKKAVVAVAPQKKPDYLERDLHPFLAYYAQLFLKAQTKTIQHNKSDKKEFGEWVHPDMVGCYFPIEDWKPEVVEFSACVGVSAIKLFSFEIKRRLNFSNLRESFFQTVSNSSWAHEGFLVAAEISTDDEFRSELRRLSTSFGVGVIRLDVADPDASEILFPPQTREYLDWDAINKLTMNPDFSAFVKRVKTDLSSREIRREKYDKVFDAEELKRLIKLPT